MAEKHPLHRVMNRPLSRREFLQYTAALFLAVFGVTQMVSRISHVDRQMSRKATRGWGGGKFGV